MEKENKILKIWKLKVRKERRGIKIGEMILKKVLWLDKKKKYEIVYVKKYEGKK